MRINCRLLVHTGSTAGVNCVFKLRVLLLDLLYFFLFISTTFPFSSDPFQFDLILALALLSLIFFSISFHFLLIDPCIAFSGPFALLFLISLGCGCLSGGSLCKDVLLLRVSRFLGSTSAILLLPFLILSLLISTVALSSQALHCVSTFNIIQSLLLFSFLAGFLLGLQSEAFLVCLSPSLHQFKFSLNLLILLVSHCITLGFVLGSLLIHSTLIGPFHCILCFHLFESVLLLLKAIVNELHLFAVSPCFVVFLLLCHLLFNHTVQISPLILLRSCFIVTASLNFSFNSSSLHLVNLLLCGSGLLFLLAFLLLSIMIVLICLRSYSTSSAVRRWLTANRRVCPGTTIEIGNIRLSTGSGTDTCSSTTSTHRCVDLLEPW